MLVKELIEKLSKLDENLEIELVHDEQETGENWYDLSVLLHNTPMNASIVIFCASRQAHYIKRRYNVSEV